MGEAADRQSMDGVTAVVGYGLKRDVAGHFDLGAEGCGLNKVDGFLEGGMVEMVEHDPVDPTEVPLLELVEGFHFNLD